MIYLKELGLILLGVFCGFLFYFAGIYLMFNSTSTFVFTIGWVGNMFGAWAVIEIMFKYPKSKNKKEVNQNGKI